MKFAALLILLLTLVILSSCDPVTKCLRCPIVENLCEKNEACVDLGDFIDIDTINGREFVKGEYIYTSTRPVIAVENPKEGGIIDIILSEFRELDQSIDIPALRSELKLEQCLCGEDIWLVKTNLLIGIEGAVAQSSTEHSENEGGSLGLNYLIKPDKSYVSVENLERINSLSKRDIDDSLYSSISSSPRVKVAILDSGILPGLIKDEGRLVGSFASPDSCELLYYESGWNFISDLGPDDNNGHGTMVTRAFEHAALNVCDEENYKPYEILNVKTMNKCGIGTSFSNACGIYFAIKEKVDYINCSWGFSASERDLQIERAIIKAAMDSIYIICSAGNKGLSLTEDPKLHYPSAYSYAATLLRYGYDQAVIDQVKNHVHEVAGLCVDPISFSGDGIKRWSNSNHRDQEMFAEPALNFEVLFNNLNVDCSFNGTSYSGPLYMGALVRARGTDYFTKPIMSGPNSEFRPHRNDQYSLSLPYCN